jgi:tetratricopeptide (TPR) repeat protein
MGAVRFLTVLGARALPAAVALVVASAPSPAQPSTTVSPPAPLSARELITRGDREFIARRASAALSLYEQALAVEPRNYDALTRAARDAIDVGEFMTDAPARTGLYRRAERYARTAVDVNPKGAEGHFELSRALGRTALAAGPRDRVKFAKEVRAAAEAAVAIDPNHAGAWHVLGVWNAEVMRLSGLTRAFARTFLGAQVFNEASWEKARTMMEKSVQLEPTRLVHKLDLARVYRDMGRAADARTTYEAALASALIDANDERYKAAAESELARLK